MIIKLLFDIPVPEVHGMTEGRILRVMQSDMHLPRRTHNRGVWVMGDAGEKVKILKGEFIELEEE